MAIASFIPHCHGNGLVISGVYSGYMQDHLIGSWICWVHVYMHIG